MDQHTSLLRLAIKALRESPAIPPTLRLYCVASDGDSRRRKALLEITYVKPLSSSSPIFRLLSPLRLFNTFCGTDDLTVDFDYKHTCKRFRNTLIRTQGMEIDGVSITAAVVKRHLVEAGMSPSTVDTLLSPNDKQDVTLMYRLLYAIARLPALTNSETVSPLHKSSRRVLRLLGTLYCFLLDPYTNVRLSLQQQLTKLSATAHMLLAIYARWRGKFILYQLYHDVMQSIKNFFFCVAKTKVDNPTGKCFIIQQGSDPLEKVFGKVRTMVGSDTNADQLQLANCIDAAVQCVKIQEVHPEWGGESRRLHLRPLQEQDDDISSAVDYINPVSWRRNMLVTYVTLQTAWQQGRQLAEDALGAAFISSSFSDMDVGDGFDILCPFGGHKAVLVNGTISTDERPEDDDEADHPPTVSGEQSATDTGTEDTVDAAVIEELAALEASEPGGSAGDPEKPRPSAFLQLEGHSKPHHKGTILRVYSNPFAITNSKDRLKRVRGLAQYTERASSGLDLQQLEDGLAVITVEDPVVTLVQCDGLVFAALMQVTDIWIDSSSVQTLAVSHIHEPNTRFRGRIMVLVPREETYQRQPDGPDWEWDHTFTLGSDISGVAGTFVEPIDPVLLPARTATLSGVPTITVRTSEFQAIGSLIYERSSDMLARLPSAKQSNTFPYRTVAGDACFMCETESGDRQTQLAQARCLHCPTFRTADVRGPQLVRHMAMHLLHDKRLKDADNPCGFCLRPGTTCAIYLKTTTRNGKRTSHIDMARSRCPNLRTLSITPAATFSSNSPCTNHPLECSLCDKGSPAVWKYNLRSHLLHVHRATVNLPEYRKLYELSEDEETYLKADWLAPKRTTRRRKRAAKVLKISDAHTSRVALR